MMFTLRYVTPPLSVIRVIDKDAAPAAILSGVIFRRLPPCCFTPPYAAGDMPLPCHYYCAMLLLPLFT